MLQWLAQNPFSTWVVVILINYPECLLLLRMFLTGLRGLAKDGLQSMCSFLCVKSKLAPISVGCFRGGVTKQSGESLGETIMGLSGYHGRMPAATPH